MPKAHPPILHPSLIGMTMHRPLSLRPSSPPSLRALGSIGAAGDKLPADRTTPIVVHCAKGRRAQAALETLQALGYTAAWHRLPRLLRGLYHSLRHTGQRQCLTNAVLFYFPTCQSSRKRIGIFFRQAGDPRFQIGLRYRADRCFRTASPVSRIFYLFWKCSPPPPGVPAFFFGEQCRGGNVTNAGCYDSIRQLDQ